MGQQIKLDDLYALINTVNNNISSKIDNVKIDIDSLTKKVDSHITEIEKKIEDLESENKELKIRIPTIERILKKNNLIFYGIPEDNNENLLTIILELIQGKIRVDLKLEDISECFRLGKATTAKRPVLLTLISGLKRNHIYHNKTNLKGTGIYLSEDLIPEDRTNRQNLVKKMKEARAQNRNAFLRGNSLVLDGVIYNPNETL
ncbi:uncharacterized protein LOC115884180 [Sitophilus oryzae]|uniref:Uncharacterized protein LOC115884180 n=1 Tax=Sitophilus oryzae TaxID=7048 RepID=A0A6J2Y401_SITOR|nr:uncharacterized protein LOC115884180 [Sitophilus oryzae]